MEKTIHNIKKHSLSLHHHVSKNHKKYIFGGFSVFLLVKIFIFLIGFVFSYGFFSQANNDMGDFSFDEIEVSSQSGILDTIYKFFGSSFNWLLNDQSVSEMENFLFGSGEVLSNTVLNGGAFKNLDESDFDKVNDILDFSRNNNLVKNGKVLKNVMLEKIQSNNNKIKVKIPKDVLVKKQVKRKYGNGKGEIKEQDYNGVMVSPQEIDIKMLNLSGESQAKYAFEVGDFNEKLVFRNDDSSESFVNILVELDSNDFSVGQMIWIKSSDDKMNWDFVGSYIVEEKTEEDRQVLFVEFLISHMTTFMVGEYNFNFFLGDIDCKTEITEFFPEQKVYACVDGDLKRLKEINHMRFSFVDETTLKKQEWFGFENRYELTLPKDFGESLSLYAHYSNDKSNYNLLKYEIFGNETKNLFRFMIGKDEFNFFLGDIDCKTEITEFFPEQEVYACVQGDDLKIIRNMRFSLQGEEDLDKQDYVEFQNHYKLMLPKDFGESLSLYAHYVNDPRETPDPIIYAIYKPDISLDINFFVGDSKCKQLYEIDSKKLDDVHLCVNGKDIRKIRFMKFGLSEEELKKSIGGEFQDTYKFSLDKNSEGEIIVFANYGPDDKNFVLLTGGVIVKRLDDESTQIGDGSVIRKGENIDLANTYREVGSTDGKSKLVINTVGKEVSLSVGVSDWDSVLYAPIVVTGSREAKKGDLGLDINFVPKQTILVGSESSSLTLNNDEKFDISFFVEDSIAGENLDIYYSNDDGNNWNSFESSCSIDINNMCNIESSHMTLFTLGSITWNNLGFVTQDFWDQYPSSPQIIDAFFGIGRSVYNWHWGRSNINAIAQGYPCRPTSIVYRNPATRGAFTVAANTIYVLNSGQYIQNGSINMSSCSALIGKGNVTISKNGNFDLITASSKSQIILDNLSLNSSGNSNRGIYFNSTHDFTINDVQAYNSTNIGIYIYRGYNSLINNTQVFNNNSYGLYINYSEYNITNNSQIFNNGSYGVYTQQTEKSSINNSLVHNNASYGIITTTSKGLIINNSQVFKNGNRGIYMQDTPDFRMNNVRSFRNTNQDLYLSSTASNGTYYGNNLIPSIYGNNFIQGSSNISLGWAAGSLSTTTPTDDGTLLSTPMTISSNSTLSWFYLGGFLEGRISTWNVNSDDKLFNNWQPDFSNNKYVLKQIQPVSWRGWTTYSGDPIPPRAPEKSSIAYHGHRFVGEYDDPIGSDRTSPMALFSGETPPQGENIIDGLYSGYFTTRAYIHEPNLFSLNRREGFPTGTTNYSIYDSGLLLMMNFDNVKEIGESNSLIRDLSIYNNRGETNGSVQWTGNGKYGGAYDLNGAVNENHYINFLPITFNQNQNRTFSSRINRLGHPPGGSYAMYAGDGTQTNSTLSLARSNLKFTINNAAGSQSSASNNSSLPYYQTGWFHLAWIASGGYINIYANGNFVEQINMNSQNGKTSMIFNNLGKVRGAFNQYGLNGYIDEVRIYNRALNPGEIEKLYTSNLSSKSDHREYEVNYTGVQNRPLGVYNYGFNTNYPLTDRDNNTNTATGYVVKSLNCGIGFSIPRDNTNFLNTGFWVPGRTDCDIIYALYGTGTTGANPTAYTQEWNDRNGQCNYTNMSVQHITPGINKLPNNLTNNTIYVLSSGTYINDYTINSNKCSAIIGTTGKIEFFMPSYERIMISSTSSYGNPPSNNIYDNIILEGKENGAGGQHQTIGYLMYQGTTNVSINHTTVKNGGQGIRVNDSSYVVISDTYVYNNEEGIVFNNDTSSSFVSGCQIYNNMNDGISFKLKNSEIIIKNSQIYNNMNAGISIAGENNRSVFNNLQVFNNRVGIATDNLGDYKNYIALNNSQIYNNEIDGLQLYYTNYFTINNSHIYNNSENGIFFAGSYNNSGILNNVFSYNNGLYGIRSEGGTHTRYGILTIFENLLGSALIQAGSLNIGSGSTYAILGRTGGTTDSTQCMNCSRTTNSYNNSNRLIDTTTYPKCNMRGQNTSRTGDSDLSYRYGVNLTGQKPAVSRVGTTLTASPLAYSGSQYIAETNKISPDYTNTQCTCSDVTIYPWNNDGFLNDGFWGTLPTYKPYCHIIASLYGSGTNGNDLTAYTQFWNSWNGECNVENVEVVYTDEVPQILTDNTIYVLSDGTQNITSSRNMANCSTILGLGDATIKKTQNIHSISSDSRKNWILDNVNIDGNGRTRDGIYIYNSSQNNTINNVNSYSNGGRGIYLYLSSDNNTIKNSNFYNNGLHGVFMSTEKNILNNSQMYNNNGFGLLINNTNNAVNNIQTYNNNIGIQIGGSNTINNVQTYNNSTDGIIFWSNGNQINNLMAYNNGGKGINTQGYQVTYFGDNRFFDNAGGDLSSNLVAGTNSPLGWSNGTMTGGSITWDLMTNPLNISDTYLLKWSDNWSSLVGINNSYNNANVATKKYSYGSGIVTQKQPVYYNNSSILTNGGLFNQNNFIGSDVPKVSGTLLGLSNTFEESNINVAGNSLSNLIGQYSIFGDISSYIIESAIGSTTGINLTLGLSTNRVVTQLLGIDRAVVGSPGFSAGGADYQSLVIDSSGTPYVAYRDNGNSSKTTVMKHNGSSWVNVGSPGFSAGGTNYQSLAIDSSGTPYVAYQDNGNGNKTTVMSFGENYFATHFQTDTKQNKCLSGWDNSNFLDNTFRDQNPTDDNILCAIYGSGGTDQTAYTQIRDGGNYSDYCDVENMSVVHVTNPNQEPFGSMSSNTVYMFPSGIHYLPNSVGMESCTAFVSSGQTTITTNDDYTIFLGKEHNVIDNIDINGNDIAYVGINTEYSRWSTLHDMEIYNTKDIGISTKESRGILLDSLNIFNGIFGIQGNIKESMFNKLNIHNFKENGIGLIYSFGNTINNTKVYNNQGVGISLQESENNSINNTLIFNNEGENSVYIAGGNNNLINNSMIFNNNGYGLVVGGEGNVLLAKSYAYNNKGIGIYIDGPSVYYYGNNYVFENDSGPLNMNHGGNISAGSANNNFGWSAGKIYDDQGIFDPISFGTSWEYLVNPQNDIDEYLLQWIFEYPYLRGIFDFIPKYPIKYSYGSGILLQSVPVVWDNNMGDWNTGLSFDNQKYIASDTIKHTGDLLIPAYVSGTNITVTGTANASYINKYNLYSKTYFLNGDSYIGNTINLATNIELTQDNDEKKMVTQIENTTNGYFATHFERSTILDTKYPNFTFANNSGPECVTGYFTITNAQDWGVGLHTAPYSFNGTTWNTTATTQINAQQPGSQNRTAYVRDLLLNIGYISATYTFTNVVPTANNFTIPGNVGNTLITRNWKTESSAAEGNCGNGSLLYDTIITQGTKGVCGVSGDIVTYTPNLNKTGSDSCVIRIKDNENSTVNFTVMVNGIDTEAPIGAPICTPAGYWFTGSTTTISCVPGAGGTVVRYTLNGTIPNTGSTTWSNQQFSNTITLRAISCDALNNCNTSLVETQTYTKDNTPPTFNFVNNSGPECVTGTLTITSPVDVGTGLHLTPYSFNGNTWSTILTTQINPQQPGTQTIIGYVRDKLLNIGSTSATYTFTDTMPTANNFTGNANVGSGTKSANRRTLSNAKDGACGTTDISFDGIQEQGTKGVCSVVGDQVTYVPNQNQYGNDSCTLKIRDNENNTINVVVNRGNINTTPNPIIFFTGVNPVNSYSLNRNRYTSQIQINQTENMDVFEYGFGGTNYSMYDSGLVLMYNFDNVSVLGEDNSTIKDLSQYNNTGVVNGAIYTGDGKRNGAYSFDGINDYILSNDNVLINGDQTYSTRVYANNTNGGLRGIFTTHNHSTFSNIGINMISTHFTVSIGYTDNTREYNNKQSNYSIIPNTWIYVVLKYNSNANSISLYVNGSLDNTWNLAKTVKFTTGKVLLGQRATSYIGINYVFDGLIDEPRIRNRALTQTEIQLLYKSNLKKFDTDKWMFEILNTCLTTNSNYAYTGYVRSIFGQSDITGRVLSTNIPALNTTGLMDFNFGVDQVSTGLQIKTGQYLDYIQVHDWIANTGWTITVEVSSVLSGQNNDNFIDSSGLFFKANYLESLLGISSTDVSLSTFIQTFQNIHQGPVDYVERVYDPNDFMCDGGTYGDKPHLKLNIPAYQSDDTYIGSLTVDTPA